LPLTVILSYVVEDERRGQTRFSGRTPLERKTVQSPIAAISGFAGQKRGSSEKTGTRYHFSGPSSLFLVPGADRDRSVFWAYAPGTKNGSVPRRLREPTTCDSTPETGDSSEARDDHLVP